MTRDADAAGAERGTDYRRVNEAWGGTAEAHVGTIRRTPSRRNYALNTVKELTQKKPSHLEFRGKFPRDHFVLNC